VFKPGQIDHGFMRRVATHFCGRLKLLANGWTLGFPEELAAVIITELDTAHPSRFAAGHAGNRR
jgi:hypothetical protein